MVGTHLSDEQLNVIVDKAVQDVDASKIDFPSFKKVIFEINKIKTHIKRQTQQQKQT